MVEKQTMTSYPDPDHEFVINNPDVLKIMADSRRIEILRSFRKALTVKELAQLLKTAPTKLYYHVNLLEEHGLIRAIDSHIVSGIIEKVYQVSAKQYRISHDLLAGPTASESSVEQVLAAVFDGAKEQIIQSLKNGLIDLNPQNSKDTVLRMGLRLSKAQLNDFSAQIEALTKQANELNKGNEGEELQPYELMLAFYPTSRPTFSEENE